MTEKEILKGVLQILNGYLKEEQRDEVKFTCALIDYLVEQEEIEYCTSCGCLILADETCPCKGIALNYCPECGMKYDEDDICYGLESENFWGAPSYQKVIIGAKCSSCGYDLEV